MRVSTIGHWHGLFVLKDFFLFNPHFLFRRFHLPAVFFHTHIGKYWKRCVQTDLVCAIMGSQAAAMMLPVILELPEDHDFSADTASKTKGPPLTNTRRERIDTFKVREEIRFNAKPSGDFKLCECHRKLHIAYK